MEGFRRTYTILPYMVDDIALDAAHRMVKKASMHGFAPTELTFYMGDIAYNKLITHMELTATRELKCEKLFGIEVKRLLDRDNDPKMLILQSNNKPKLTLSPLAELYATNDITTNRIVFHNFYRPLSTNLGIKKVIFNDPATIILWKDGTKTVVQAQGEDFDPEKGMAMAIAKKALGNQGNYYDIFKEWLPEEEEDFYNPFKEVVFSSLKMGPCEIEVTAKKIRKGNKDED